MAVAENRLSCDMVKQRLMAAVDFPQSMLYYQDMRGIPEVRASIAGMMQATFMKVSVCCDGAVGKARCSG